MDLAILCHAVSYNTIAKSEMKLLYHVKFNRRIATNVKNVISYIFSIYYLVIKLPTYA